MKQVIQNFKTGDLFVDVVPYPSIFPGYVLVRNHYSLISAGTERTTVSTGKASLLGKARHRPDLVKQVIDYFRKEGFSETFKKVSAKLKMLKELGYCCAGTVLMSMDTEGRFKPGDRVACGGDGASHAGVVSVPQNLVTKVPSSVSLDHAAFTTLGAIAIQGIRQANPRIGDFVCVIGLGLLGQLAAQILRANGCQVFGIDISKEMAERSAGTSCHAALTRNDADLESRIDQFTEGRGFDSVIVTAASQSSDPIELATAILRQKGSVIVVGAVPMNIPREPHFYKKELELKISCSYGPGRYDPAYEEGGHDYPYGYVRWTENRNMAAFTRLLENKSIDLRPLISHVFDIEQAEEAYDIVTGKKKEKYIGILLKYPASDEKLAVEAPVGSPTVQGSEQGIQLGFVGAGSFAQKYLIPYAGSFGALSTVVTSHGVTAKNVGEKFKFRSFSTDAKDVFSKKEITAVFIATRHNTHADLAVAALEAGKNVFVEKPLAICEEDLERLARVARQEHSKKIMVGFNRRFSPLAKLVKERFGGLGEPLLINYRVNAGFIPKDHWVQTDEGGGRILGEVCHFIDLLQFLTGSDPDTVFAENANNVNSKMASQDNVVVTLRFLDGSVGNITYVACGDKLLNKERVEVFGGGRAFVIDDFKVGEYYSNGHCEKIRQSGKGYKEEIEAFFKSIREGLPSPISFDSLFKTSATTFRIIDSLRTGLPQKISS